MKNKKMAGKKTKAIFVYVLNKIKENEPNLNKDDLYLKTQKVLYLSELIYRIIFGKKLITDGKYICLNNGPAICNLGKNAVFNYRSNFKLDDIVKEKIDCCLKNLIMKSTTNDLIEITHGENKDIPLEAWKILRSKNKSIFTEKLINKDVDIMKKYILSQMEMEMENS